MTTNEQTRRLDLASLLAADRDPLFQKKSDTIHRESHFTSFDEFKNIKNFYANDRLRQRTEIESKIDDYLDKAEPEVPPDGISDPPHTKVKRVMKWKCPTCSQWYARKGSLKTHMFTHTQHIHRYYCEKCAMGCTTPHERVRDFYCGPKRKYRRRDSLSYPDGNFHSGDSADCLSDSQLGNGSYTQKSIPLPISMASKNEEILFKKENGNLTKKPLQNTVKMNGSSTCLPTTHNSHVLLSSKDDKAELKGSLNVSKSNPLSSSLNLSKTNLHNSANSSNNYFYHKKSLPFVRHNPLNPYSNRNHHPFDDRTYQKFSYYPSSGQQMDLVYQCPVCVKGYKTSWSLNIHMQSHQNDSFKFMKSTGFITATFPVSIVNRILDEQSVSKEKQAKRQLSLNYHMIRQNMFKQMKKKGINLNEIKPPSTLPEENK